MTDPRRRGTSANEPVSVRALVTRFALTGFVALVVVAMITAIVSRRVATEQAITDAQRVAWVSGQGIIAPGLTDAVIANDRTALQALDEKVRRFVLRGSLVRVKIWTADGTIVYSDEPRLIGEQFVVGAETRAVLATGSGSAHVSNLEEPENRFEVEPKLLEVYERIETMSGTPLLFEAYFRYSGVSAVGRELWGKFAPIAIGALIALQLAQLPFAWRMARRLRSGQEERERLLRHAVEASDAERRRIASDLHDGVVQELTGVSLGLAALSRTSDVDPEAAAAASASIRTSIKSLRSLLVEIYPPNLHDEGLESAIGDLLSGLPSRGITTHLDAEVGDVVIDPDAVGLLYRTVQEAIRNVVTHSRATAVNVTLRVVDDEATVSVDDNGTGCTLEEIDQRSAEGHVGLRALSGLLADSGGRLEVLSAKSTGTRVLATVPIRMGVRA